MFSHKVNNFAYLSLINLYVICFQCVIFTLNKRLCDLPGSVELLLILLAKLSNLCMYLLHGVDLKKRKMSIFEIKLCNTRFLLKCGLTVLEIDNPDISKDSEYHL